MSYNKYYAGGWQSGEVGATPITPEALNHIEEGIEQTYEDLAAKTHGNHVPTVQTADNATFLRNDNTWQKVTPANIGAAASSHGNHVPATQTASNKVFLRNDNTWQTVTPANIGAAASSHNHAASNITSGTLALARGGTGSSGASVSSASNSYHTAYFSKFGNLVICSILPKSADGTQYDTSITIPSGYRPSSSKTFQFYSWTNKNAGGAGTVTISVQSGGALRFQQAYGFSIHDIKYTLSWTV